MTTGYGYDAALRLQSLSQTTPSSADNVTFSFLYNAAGQVRSRTISNGAYVFTRAGQVDNAYTVNGLNQMTAAGSAAVTYDAPGQSHLRRHGDLEIRP